MIFTVAGKELRAMFSSPMGWVILALLQAVFAHFGFFAGIDQYFNIMSGAMRPEQRMGVTEFVGSNIFNMASFVMLVAVPLLSMRLISEERKNQTLTFLFSAPLTLTEIVLGKFIGLVGFLTIVIAFLAAMISSLNLWTDMDFGYIAANVIGLWFLVASFAALGVFVSSLTQQPIIAAIISFIALFALLAFDQYLASDPNSFFNHVSLMRHFEPFSRGLLDTRDFSYFILFIFTFLTLTVRRLDADRLRG
ncbi:MAG TPA: ABC transporter permease subunit [Methylophilaceae bacterium]|jgi:ABC-2 type transport system permease protein